MPLRRRPRETEQDPQRKEWTWTTGAKEPPKPRVTARRPPGKK